MRLMPSCPLEAVNSAPPRPPCPSRAGKARLCPGSGHVGRGSFVGSADSEVLGWGFSCKGCVGSVVVIEVLEGLDHLGDFVDSHWQVGAGIELIAPGPVAALDGPVELGRSGRQDIEGEVFGGAGLLE